MLVFEEMSAHLLSSFYGAVCFVVVEFYDCFRYPGGMSPLSKIGCTHIFSKVLLTFKLFGFFNSAESF